MSDSIVRDIRVLSSRIPVGSFIFATVDARMPPGLYSLSGAERLAIINEEYAEFALATAPRELTPESFPNFSERVLWASLSESLLKRREGQFVPLIRVFYKDSTLMMTVGACLCSHERAPSLRKRLKDDFGFLMPEDGESAYSIPSFNLTLKERQLLDEAVTRRQGQRSLNRSLRRLGFSASEVADYKLVFRFIPKYFESYI